MTRLLPPQLRDIDMQVKAELARASELYPRFPKDVVKAVAIVAEECGEAIRAANDHDVRPTDETRRDVHDELIQTMAMCIRVLQNSLYEDNNGA